MSEFEKFKSSKINLSKDLFDKIQSTLYKMKIPTMIGVTEQDVLKYEEEKIINPLFKKLFTEPLPNKTIVQMIKDSQHDTKDFADLVGINVDNIINKEGVLENGQFFPDNNENNELDYNEPELNFNSPEKKEANIKLELIKKNNNKDENVMDKNNQIWKKDKEFFEFDIPTYLEMTKEENEDMTIDDIKNAFYKNLDKVNNDSTLKKFKQNLINNKYNLANQEFFECEDSIQKDLKTMNLFGYYFYGNGKDYYNYIKNEVMSGGNSSDRRRYDIAEILTSEKLEIKNETDNSLNEYKGKTFNPVNNIEFNMDDTSIYEINSKIKKIGDSQSVKESEKDEKEQKISSEIIKELNKSISKTKFYQNVKLGNFVDALNENTVLINDYNEKEKKSFIFYNLLISCQINGFNLQQNNLFSDFFFVKNN